MPSRKTSIEDVFLRWPHLVQYQEAEAKVLLAIVTHRGQRRTIEIVNDDSAFEPACKFLVEVDDNSEIRLTFAVKIRNHRPHSRVGDDTVAQRGFDERGNIGRFGLSEQRSDKSDRNQRDNSKQIASGGLSP